MQDAAQIPAHDVVEHLTASKSLRSWFEGHVEGEADSDGWACLLGQFLTPKPALLLPAQTTRSASRP